MKVEDKFRQLTREIGVLKTELKDVKARLNIISRHNDNYEVRPEYIKKLNKIRKGKFIRVEDFAKRYGIK